MKKSVTTRLSGGVVDGVAIWAQKLGNLNCGFALNGRRLNRDVANENGASFFVSRLHMI
jgi:hypothetical protein